MAEFNTSNVSGAPSFWTSYGTDYLADDPYETNNLIYSPDAEDATAIAVEAAA